MKDLSDARLLKIVRLKAMIEEKKLGSLAKKEARLQDQISSLTSDRLREGQAGRSVEDPAVRVGMDGLWQAWVAVRQTQLNSELLRVRMLKESQRDALRMAYGKADVLNCLRELTLQSQARRREQRSSYED